MLVIETAGNRERDLARKACTHPTRSPMNWSALLTVKPTPSTSHPCSETELIMDEIQR
jgi:hypothetical protein